jgi:hypothetical protein
LLLLWQLSCLGNWVDVQSLEQDEEHDNLLKAAAVAEHTDLAHCLLPSLLLDPDPQRLRERIPLKEARNKKTVSQEERRPHPPLAGLGLFSSHQLPFWTSSASLVPLVDAAAVDIGSTEQDSEITQRERQDTNLTLAIYSQLLLLFLFLSLSFSFNIPIDNLWINATVVIAVARKEMRIHSILCAAFAHLESVGQEFADVRDDIMRSYDLFHWRTLLGVLHHSLACLDYVRLDDRGDKSRSQGRRTYELEYLLWIGGLNLDPGRIWRADFNDKCWKWLCCEWQFQTK